MSPRISSLSIRAVLLAGMLLGLADMTCAQTGAVVVATSQDPNGWGSGCVKPKWPKESLIREEEGTVVIKFLVDIDGKVLETRVRKSSGFPLLDQAAQQAIERCRFSPDTADGKPVQAWQSLQYVWTLDDPNPWQYKFPPMSGLNR